MGSDFDTVWGEILFFIISGLFVYFVITHVETFVWFAPLPILILPLIICPLCDIVGKKIQDFIDKFK